MNDLSSLGLRLTNGKLLLLNQTRLPAEERWETVDHPEAMIGHIKTLAVRGAPLIGVAAALSLGLFSKTEKDKTVLRNAALALREARPTAVNLMIAIDRMLAALDRNEDLSVEAEKIFHEDVELCERMAERGAQFINSGDNILTHCNTGGLATAGIGTALGVIKKAHEQGKAIHVYVDETRPLLQGARLTAWELDKLGISYTLICDNMAASLMSRGKVQKIFVGADRIAKNGDFANKIGTYSLAVVAKHHGVPFYTVAPSTTFDPECPDGLAIPIEERSHDEVRDGRSPKDAPVWNPAFDVTPRTLITKVIFDDRFL